MDTTSYVGVYLLLKNKVFGSLGELFINSTVWRKVSHVVFQPLLTKNLYVLRMVEKPSW